MVLDEVLEVEMNGEMLCGTDAMQIIDELRTAAPEPQKFLAALSRRALQYAEALHSLSAGELAQRLYSFNRIPASARWRRLLPNRMAVRTYLGVDGALGRSFAAAWSELPAQGADGWIAWQSTRLAPPRGGLTHKLYVSPTCAAVGSVMHVAIEAVSRFGAFHFKVGGDVYGLLRPDKLILYFEHFSDLQRGAAYLMEQLAGCPSHGVPFTAELEPRGLLSWGLDPSHKNASVPWLERESWRSRICSLLALALTLAGKRSADGVSASHFALQRLRLEGIDTDTWTPTR